jgi:lauroyl/myristoyl acyltransferase
VLAQLAHADLAPVEEALARGRGALLAAAHLGPDLVASTAIRDRYPDTLFLLREAWRGPGRARVLVVDDGANRGAALVEAHRELRAGGLVYLAPDGISGPLDLRVPLRGGHVPMGAGAAALARLGRAPAFPVVAAWIGGRMEILVGRAIEPAPADLDWLTRYLEQVDRWSSRLPPENLRLHGSVYERWVPPPSVDSAGTGR